MDLTESFASVNGAYDRQRRALTPCFDVFYKSVVTRLSFDGPCPRRADGRFAVPSGRKPQ